ncbi:hypothetical protein AB5J62_03315 [Amycolatopsis sp. cg5]|uniref:hypothetical protein n=1 Tax=Amycolatopsis sp. cg5 TaxID=3238802 RepID=UPI0035258AFC
MPSRTPRRHLKAVPDPSSPKETYAEKQARLAAEAVDRWAVIVADWPPMSQQQIDALALILNRIETRLRNTDQDRAA